MILTLYKGANVQPDYSEVYESRDLKIEHLNKLPKTTVTLQNIYLSYEGSFSVALNLSNISYNYMLADPQDATKPTKGYFINIIDFHEPTNTATVQYRYDFFFNTAGAYDPWQKENPNMLPKWDIKGICTHSFITNRFDCQFTSLTRLDTDAEDDFNNIILFEGTYKVIYSSGTDFYTVAFMGCAMVPNTDNILEDFNIISEVAPYIYSMNGTQITAGSEKGIINITKASIFRGEIGELIIKNLETEKILPYTNKPKGYMFSLQYGNAGKTVDIYSVRFYDNFGFYDGAGGKSIEKDINNVVLNGEDIYKSILYISTPMRSIKCNYTNQKIRITLFINNKRSVTLNLIYEGCTYDISEDFRYSPIISNEQAVSENIAKLTNAFIDSEFQITAQSAAFKGTMNAAGSVDINPYKTAANFITAAASTAEQIYARKKITDINKERNGMMAAMKSPSASHTTPIAYCLLFHENFGTDLIYKPEFPWDYEDRYYKYYGFGGEVYIESINEVVIKINAIEPYVEMETVEITGEITETEKEIISAALKKGVKFIKSV